MSRTQHEQLYELIQQSTNPLITFKNDSSGDVIASSLVLQKLLNKWDRSSTIISPDFKLPSNLKFLDQTNAIQPNLTASKKITITLDHPSVQQADIQAESELDKLHIHIQANEPTFSPEHITINDSKFNHDLIITLNTPDLTALDAIYEKNTDLFYQVPIVNIDHSPENEHYGHLNLINITATSISEILFELIETLDSSLIDENIATHLLTGMIEKTKSFKIPTITPKTLNIASQLMAAGAERDAIIKNLYQTRSVNTLRLWGKTLLKLETTDNHRIAWAELNEQDFLDTRTSEKELIGVMEELISNIPTVELSIIFYTTQNQEFALIKSEKGIDLKSHFINKAPTGYKSLIKIPSLNNRDNILATIKGLI